MHHKNKGSTGCHLSIQLSERPCRSITRIRKKREPLLFALFIELGKVMSEHIDLTPNLHKVRPSLPLESVRDALDRQSIGRNELALHAIALKNGMLFE